MRKNGTRTKAAANDEKSGSSGKVVDFMAILHKSLKDNQRTPAKRTQARKRNSSRRRQRKRA